MHENMSPCLTLVLPSMAACGLKTFVVRKLVAIWFLQTSILRQPYIISMAGQRSARPLTFGVDPNASLMQSENWAKNVAGRQELGSQAYQNACPERHYRTLPAKFVLRYRDKNSRSDAEFRSTENQVLHTVAPCGLLTAPLSLILRHCSAHG